MTTGPATNLATHRVTLTGTIDPRGTVTKYYFEYSNQIFPGYRWLGADWRFDTASVPLYTERAPFVAENVGADSHRHVVRQTLTGPPTSPPLQPGVTYHYRLVAIVDNKPVYGADRSFTLPAAARPRRRPGTIDVLEPPYSAAGDGATNDRAAIQHALDAAANKGGGTVLLPAGHTFLSGRLYLRTGTTLQIEGTLLQSSNAADYASPPDVHNPWDDPFVEARDIRHFAVTGHGVIQGGGIDETLIGTSHASHFVIRDVHVKDSRGVVAVWIMSSDHGVVQGISVTQARTGSTAYKTVDGFAIINSQHIRVTGSYIRSSDLALEIDEFYGDRRPAELSTNGSDPYHHGWLSTEPAPQPTTHIEIDHNNFYSVSDDFSAFVVIPLGAYIRTNYPDARKAAISDLDIHDNAFLTGMECYCDYVPTGKAYYPVSRMRFSHNVFRDRPNIAKGMPGSTDSRFDFPITALGQNLSVFQNPKFEFTGDAWWTTVGNAGATRDTTPPPTPDDGVGTNWAGYVRSDSPRGVSELFEGLTLFGRDSGHTNGYLFTVDVRVQGTAALFARDVCRGTMLAQKPLTAGGWRNEQLVIPVQTSCADVQIGVRVTRGRGKLNWAMIDNAVLVDKH